MGETDLDHHIQDGTVDIRVSHVALAGADGHTLREPVDDLLDLLLCGGGVDLDVRMTDQDVVKVGHLQMGPFLAEQKGEAVLECSEIF